MPYEFLEDLAIADVQFRAYGKDLPEVFISAADATTNVMVRNLESVRIRQSLHLTIEHDELDMLLFNFLQELIYFKDTERLLLRAEQVTIEGDDSVYRLEADLAGETLDPSRHDQGADVKAVTLHRFSLKQDEHGWSAYVILDI